jgi:peroxiredoxin Q/BCP
MAAKLKLKEGDVAPGFSAMTSGGGRVSLADFKGRNIGLYFYFGDDKRVVNVTNSSATRNS